MHGLFAIAFAYELADGNDRPSDVSFDQEKKASTFSSMLRERTFRSFSKTVEHC